MDFIPQNYIWSFYLLSQGKSTSRPRYWEAELQCSQPQELCSHAALPLHLVPHSGDCFLIAELELTTLVASQGGETVTKQWLCGKQQHNMSSSFNEKYSGCKGLHFKIMMAQRYITKVSHCYIFHSIFTS